MIAEDILERERERLDRYVCAALTGLLASTPPSNTWTPVAAARTALEYAEAALEEVDRSKA